MQIIRSMEELRDARRDLRGTLALVPTMGALHEGHLALVRAARQQARHAAVSIFVNPRQFGPSEDLARYPRDEARDLALLEREGVEFVWLPSVDDLYPAGFATTVEVHYISERWEGAARPGHFEGVATVVAKLLIAAAPDLALFGEKDWQQLAVIRRLALDLGLPVEIGAVPTVRDPDGLALSSRNAYLSPEQRAAALALPGALQAAARDILGGDAVAEVLRRSEAALRKAGFSTVDYFALVHADSLEPLEQSAENMRLIAAATVGSTRLIDNLGVTSEQQVRR